MASANSDMGVTINERVGGFLWISLNVIISLCLFYTHPIALVIYALIVTSLLSRGGFASTLLFFSFSAAFCYVFYLLFYSIAPTIWQWNRVIDPNLIAPDLRGWYTSDRDGYEAKIVYAGALLILGLSLFVAMLKLEKKPIPIFAKSLFAFLPLIYLTKINLIAPFGVVNDFNLIHFLVCGAILGFFMALIKKFPKFGFLALIGILIPICFVGTKPISTSNYAYIFNPALKILNGVGLKEIYMQYDLFLSIIPIPLLALKLDPNYIQLAFQASLYGLFLSLLFFGNKFFKNKILVVPFILTLVFIRIFASYYDPTFVFQITPLRLDLWVIPLLLALKFGIFHWSLGLCFGTMIFFHTNFGIIYTLAFYQMSLFLQLVVGVEEYREQRSFPKVIQSFSKQLYQNLKVPSLFVVSGFLLKGLVFQEFGMNHAAKLYQEFGFGFDRISPQSFFWLLLLLVVFSFVVVIRLVRGQSQARFGLSLFIVTLSVGNSLYFLGRSHESNLLWISSSFILLLYIVFDSILGEENESKNANIPKRFFVLSLPFALYFGVCSIYAKTSTDFFNIQWSAIKSANVPYLPSTEYGIEGIKEATKGSDKLFVISGNDFYIYYYLDANPVAYFSPFGSWVYNNDLNEYVGSLLDQGYYVVCDTCPNETSQKFESRVSTQKVGRYHIYKAINQP